MSCDLLDRAVVGGSMRGCLGLADCCVCSVAWLAWVRDVRCWSVGRRGMVW